MTLPSLRRLALADLDEPTLRRLVEQGEDLFVERKREPPPAPRFGAQVASFANSLGGWLLLGVDDDGTVVGWEPDAQLDVQSHIGNLLRNEVDPVPPFVADTYSLDGVTIGVVRVFEAADTPVIVRESGAVFVRHPGGKQPVTDHRTLLELARRGQAAREEAQARLGSLQLVQRALDSPERRQSPEIAAVMDTDHIRVLVRAGPVTVTPQFSEWPISDRGADAIWAVTDSFMPSSPGHSPVTTLEPYGRGVAASCVGGYPGLTQFTIVADSGGVVGASIKRDRVGGNFGTTEGLRRHWIRPLIDRVARALTEAEAFGAAVWDLWICMPMNFYVEGEGRSPSRATHFSADLALPADEEELRELAARWEREFAREAGIGGRFEGGSAGSAA